MRRETPHLVRTLSQSYYLWRLLTFSLPHLPTYLPTYSAYYTHLLADYLSILHLQSLPRMIRPQPVQPHNLQRVVCQSQQHPNVPAHHAGKYPNPHLPLFRVEKTKERGLLWEWRARRRLWITHKEMRRRKKEARVIRETRKKERILRDGRRAKTKNERLIKE